MSKILKEHRFQESISNSRFQTELFYCLLINRILRQPLRTYGCRVRLYKYNSLGSVWLEHYVGIRCCVVNKLKFYSGFSLKWIECYCLLNVISHLPLDKLDSPAIKQDCHGPHKNCLIFYIHCPSVSILLWYHFPKAKTGYFYMKYTLFGIC